MHKDFSAITKRISNNLRTFREDMPDALKAFPPRDALCLWRMGRIQGDPDYDTEGKKYPEDYPWDNAGHEQLAYRGLRCYSIDHKGDARRDKDVQGGAYPDGTGG